MSEEKEYFGSVPRWLRLTVLPWYIWAFMIGAAIAGVLYASKAGADTSTMVYSDSQMTLRLLNKPCVNETVLSYLKQAARPRYQAAILVWEGRTLQSCWRLTDDKAAVMNIDEEGDGLQPPLPVEVFKRDAGA